MDNNARNNFAFGPRRGVYTDISTVYQKPEYAVDQALVDELENLDLIYRTLTGIL